MVRIIDSVDTALPYGLVVMCLAVASNSVGNALTIQRCRDDTSGIAGELTACAQYPVAGNQKGNIILNLNIVSKEMSLT